ncbi:MAG: hypothetical protein KDB07_05785 [Planctomycetes bacterium]|nr:hypothetical protein [Planctomycetota bacterium]
MKFYLTLAAIVALFLVIGPQSSFGQRNKGKGAEKSLGLRNYSEVRVLAHADYEPFRNTDGEIDDILSPEGRAHLRLRADPKLGQINAVAVDARMKVTSDVSRKNLFALPELKEGEKRKKFYWSGEVDQGHVSNHEKTDYLRFDFTAPPRKAKKLNIDGKVHVRFLADMEVHTTKELTKITSKQSVFSHSKLGVKVYAEPAGEDAIKLTWEGDVFRITQIEWLAIDNEVVNTERIYSNRWDGFESVKTFTDTLKYSCRLRMTIAKTVNIEAFEIDHEDYKLP